MKPKPFNVLLTADQRAKLEAHRAAFGLRSEGDAIRHLIEAYGSGQLRVKVTENTSSHPVIARAVATGDLSGIKVYGANGPEPLNVPNGAAITVQTGPITPKPGSRLKKR